MESVHQIITVSLWILTLLPREVYRCHKNIFISTNPIKSKFLIYHFKEVQHKYMSGEIYQ
jgi:hypothetical protein